MKKIFLLEGFFLVQLDVAKDRGNPYFAIYREEDSLLGRNPVLVIASISDQLTDWILLLPSIEREFSWVGGDSLRILRPRVRGAKIEEIRGNGCHLKMVQEVTDEIKNETFLVDNIGSNDYLTKMLNKKNS